jgi:hypothetical protein
MENMGIDHGCLDILMSKQFLHGTYVITILKQVRGKRMAKGVRGNGFIYPGPLGRFFDRALQYAFIKMVTADLAGPRTG